MLLAHQSLCNKTVSEPKGTGEQTKTRHCYITLRIYLHMYVLPYRKPQPQHYCCERDLSKIPFQYSPTSSSQTPQQR